MTESQDYNSYDAGKISIGVLEGSIFINPPETSDWDCYMFGNKPGGRGLCYTPQKGMVPNRFVRFMMRICFGCTWIKKK